MTGNLRKSAGARIAKAQHTWALVSRRILRCKVIHPRIKITIWGSLFRSTIIYGLHTKELPRNLIRRLGTYMYKQIGAMVNPGWEEESWYPGGTALPGNKAIGDGIMAERDENYDNAQADAWR